MLARTTYAISACWRYRGQLQQFMSDPSLQINQVISLTPEDLFGHDVQGLILDFDGVLAPHAQPEPNPEVLTWLRDFAAKFAPYQIYILSNKPTMERLLYFKNNFPNISFITSVRKKPYPDGLLQIITMSNLPAHSLLLVDDRLATGIVAAISVGMQGCWVTQPYADLQARPIRERFFRILRWIEKKLIKLLG